jgi:hypothetical protein
VSAILFYVVLLVINIVLAATIKMERFFQEEPASGRDSEMCDN